MAHTPDQLLGPLLKAVSRSFYLTLRVLPGSIRPQIGLAYLLARTTDTIADTELVPVEARLGALRALRDRIAGRSDRALDFSTFTSAQSSSAEKTLLEQCEPALALLRALTPPDRQRVVEVLEIIASGQELDLQRFAGGSRENVLALRTQAELDDYTYRVAGCVGEFWTKMCRAHLFPRARLDDQWLLHNGVRFGKGLQLVNILRDLPADLRQGRCYLPASGLAELGLKPRDLLRPEAEPAMRPLYEQELDLAEAHLRAGWDYTVMLPRNCVRVKLACAWPILIGWETLGLLRSNEILPPERRLKLSRARVRRLMARSVFLYPWKSAWNSLVPVAAAAAKPGGKAVDSGKRLS
jgi:farnesyl-diphosphate farnesyltransferase